jgi:hypothetical protein
MTSGLPLQPSGAARLGAVALCILAGGCAVPYRDVLESGHKYTAESIRKPPDVADCVAARLKKQREWQLTRRPLGDRGSIELVVGSSGEGVVAVAHVHAFPYGSRIESWITPRAVLTRDIWQEEFFGGC